VIVRQRPAGFAIENDWPAAWAIVIKSLDAHWLAILSLVLTDYAFEFLFARR
jgi:hypothetical protein